MHPRYPFFLPVKVLSQVFRGRFLAGLKTLYRRRKLRCSSPAAGLAAPKQFAKLLRRLHREGWVVYTKPAMGGPVQVLGYLGRDTHRLAISNHWLLSFDGERVASRWKDYAHGGKQREMTLQATEFLRRFCLHVLPKGFVRIRHFGFLANRFRARLLPLARLLLASAPMPDTSTESEATTWRCPYCDAPMIVIKRFTAAELRFEFFDSSRCRRQTRDYRRGIATPAR